jgi:phosphoesterase RecJ-like protein
MECHPAQNLATKLLKAEHVLLLTHQRPDGDALGSTFGMRDFLRANGIAADVLIPHGALPRRYTRMFTGYLPQVTLEELDKFDCILALDCSTSDRLGIGDDFSADDLRTRNFLCIDHHAGNSLEAGEKWVVPQSGSTCQMVMELIDALDMPTTRASATFRLMGMMTDTGRFCFEDYPGSSFSAAAVAVKHGADVALIANAIFFSKPLNQLKFEAALVDRALHTACDGKLAYACASPELLAEFNFDINEDEGLIDILRGLEGVVIAMLVHRRADGWRVSLRSKDSRYPVRQIAENFGGGGHDLAAGCTIDVPEFSELEEKILPIIEKLLMSQA